MAINPYSHAGSMARKQTTNSKRPPAVAHPYNSWSKQFICSVLLLLSRSTFTHILFVLNPKISLSVSLLFLNTHPPPVITQTTVWLVSRPAEFQIGPFDKDPEPQSPRFLLPEY